MVCCLVICSLHSTANEVVVGGKTLGRLREGDGSNDGRREEGWEEEWESMTEREWSGG